MKRTYVLIAVALMGLTTSALAFDTTTVAKVKHIDEWDNGYTQVGIESPTSCGEKWFFIHREHEDYDVYMSRVLAALISDREIRITERAPAWCTAPHLYNPRIGNM